MTNWDRYVEVADFFDAKTVKNKKQLRSWNNELIVTDKEYNRIMSEEIRVIKRIKCLNNFYSVTGKIVFKEGKFYPISESGIIDNGSNYFLHWTNELTKYFKR